MVRRTLAAAAVALSAAALSGCLIIGPCGDLCFVPPELFLTDLGETGEPRGFFFDLCDVCADLSCGGVGGCFRSGTTECSCELGPGDDVFGQSRVRAAVVSAYDPPAFSSFVLGNAFAGHSPAHRLTFDTTPDNLQTFEAEITYPDGFGFNGFTARGPAGTQVGVYAMDLDKNGVPDFALPVLASGVDTAFGDVDRNGMLDPIDATIVHGEGSHVFTVTLPFGGDGIAARLLGPIPIRITVLLYPGILVNPPAAPGYEIAMDFTSVDPESGGDDDALGQTPLSLEATALRDIVPSPLATLDHYLCYKTKPSRGSLCRPGASANEGAACAAETDCGGVAGATDFCIKNKLPKGIAPALADAFEDKDFALKKPVRLCVPVDKNGEGIHDAATHLRDYAITEVKQSCPTGAPENEHRACASSADCGGAPCGKTPRHEKRPGLALENQLGTLIVGTTKPNGLLVPTAKDLAQPPAPPGPSGVDHYKCYKVKEAKKRCADLPEQKCKRDADCGLGGPCIQRFPKGIQVQVEDQLTSPAKTVDVKKPTRLCLPVDKNGEGVATPAGHLVCYQVKPARGAPKHMKRLGVHVANQLVRERLDTQKEDELCVPAVRTAVL